MLLDIPFQGTDMIAFEVNDMTCGHCVSSITKAVRTVDAGAKVDIDLARHLVQIEAGEADAQALSDAIRSAGYTPTAVTSASRQAVPAKRSGCCCG
jgi:copper chaperone